MGNLYQSTTAKGTTPSAYPDCAGDIIAQRATFVVPAAIAAGDIIEMAILPANCRLIDVIAESDDLDTNGAPTMKFDVGIMSGEVGVNDNTRTCGAEIFSASTLPQAGGVARPTLSSAFRIAPSAVQRSIGIKVNTAAATGAAGTVNLTLLYASIDP